MTNTDDLAALPERVAQHLDGLDGVVHAIAFAPEAALGGNFLNTGWDDVSTALHVSAYSLKALTTAALPLMPNGGSVVGLDFDASVAWPLYDWMGVAKAALESCARYLARDLGKHNVRVNLVSAGPIRTMAAKGIPGFDELAAIWEAGRRWRGTSPTPSRPPGRSSPCCPTGFRRRPARSCMSTAASTRWAAEPEGPSYCWLHAPAHPPYRYASITAQRRRQRRLVIAIALNVVVVVGQVTGACSHTRLGCSPTQVTISRTSRRWPSRLRAAVLVSGADKRSLIRSSSGHDLGGAGERRPASRCDGLRRGRGDHQIWQPAPVHGGVVVVVALGAAVLNGSGPRSCTSGPFARARGRSEHVGGDDPPPR